ncbi:hypothetical protein N7456_009553 [Penicillium angulare]|uniref:NmrA-like domain-containing protein n=1 Tax=Penicillium angulare TaxID=116970 RepID=A0A9W9K694_9EURO|nr:hypothetical protein N7456_009553 [Penicillium angulare]
MSKVILVTGATGKQGGSLIDKLLEENADVEILAVTRDSTSNSAQKLKGKSPKIQLVQGNLDDPKAIFSNAKNATKQPIWGVFSVQVPSPTASVQEVEMRQGKTLVDAALENNVKFFVYSSVDRGGDASYDTPTDIPHFTSKHYIEHHLVEKSQGTDMAWTILRPVAFLENLTPDFLGKFFATTWKIVVKDKPLQVISTADIGWFAAQAFVRPDEWKNRAISLVGDELTFQEMARIFKAKTGRDVPLTFGFVCRIMLWVLGDFGKMFNWFHDKGYSADVAALKKMNPGLRDFATWLETESGFSTQ